jgi:ParB family transcriptional regulator, chromosome partitioning protein
VSKPGGLGRGLASLIPTGGSQGEVGEQKELPIEQVFPNPEQPRTQMNEEYINELADSISKVGILQPVIVRPRDTGYQIIAGERRWRAARVAGLETIPVRIMHADETEALELALIENLQRQDLNPVEEARGYRRLLSEYQMTQAELADKVSKSRSAITNALRLLDLPEEVLDMLFEGKMSAGHARAVLSIADDQKRTRLATKIVDEGLSVREAENLSRLYLAGEMERTPRPVTPKAFKLVARRLRRVLGTAVRVKQAQNKGKIEIDFQNEEDLERIFRLISSDPASAGGAEA